MFVRVFVRLLRIHLTLLSFMTYAKYALCHANKITLLYLLNEHNIITLSGRMVVGFTATCIIIACPTKIVSSNPVDSEV